MRNESVCKRQRRDKNKKKGERGALQKEATKYRDRRERDRTGRATTR